MEETMEKTGGARSLRRLLLAMAIFTTFVLLAATAAITYFVTKSKFEAKDARLQTQSTKKYFTSTTPYSKLTSELKKTETPTVPALCPSSKYCLTADCVETAQLLLPHVNLSVHPCEDFYEYACGGYIRSSVIPAGFFKSTSYVEILEKNQVILRQALEEPLSNSQSTAEKKAREFYQSCMDENNTIDQLGAAPLMSILNNTGAFSFFPNAIRLPPWDFQTLIERVHLFKTNALFGFWVEVDNKKSSSKIIALQHSGWGISPSYLLGKTDSDIKKQKAYHKFMTTVGMLLGGEENETSKCMQDIIDFEKKLTSISSTIVELRNKDKTYNVKKLGEFKDLYPYLDWLQFFRSQFGLHNITIDNSERILVKTPAYFGNLTSIINEMLSSKMGKRTINNYLVWQIVQDFCKYLSKPFQDAMTEFIKEITG